MRKRHIPILILIIYCAMLIKIMVFKDMPMIRVGSLMLNFGGTDGGHPPNLVPFKTILPYLFGHKGLIIAGINLVGNIALLVPVGCLAPLVFRNIRWKKSLILAVASGLFIELLQTVLRVGIFDIDDVILNALGVMIGYWAFMVAARWVRSRQYAHLVVAVIALIAVSVTAWYALFPRGQRQVDGGMGAGGRVDQFETIEGDIPQGGDLCGGTGGIGPIIGLGRNTLTIQRRKDGVTQVINLTDRTVIKTPAGPATAADLKVGDPVTVVIDETETASVVLVCGVSDPGSQSEQ